MVADGMHNETSDWVDDWRSTSIEKVDGFIAGIPGTGCLPASVLAQYRDHGCSRGWRISVDFSDGVRRDLHVLADDDFPYTWLRIVVADRPDILTWPHLDAEGVLCVLPPETAVSSENPVVVAKYVLGQACHLIEKSIHGRNIEDFRWEFLSYWKLSVGKSYRRYISLLKPLGPSRRVSVWRGQQVRIVGENPEALQRWLERWGVKKNSKGQGPKLYNGVLIWLPKPLVPAEYPGTASDVRALAQKWSSAKVNVLEEIAASGADEIDVVLGAQTPNGTCLAELTVQPPRPADAARGRGDVLEKGFRPGHVPRKLMVNRYLSGGAKVTKANVDRADHLWIHGRDRDPRQECLRHARVAILGCGSVGATPARLLAQAGIGNLLLVDPHKMDWPNIVRHELCADSVGKYKAVELAHKIEKAYPHLGEITYRVMRVGVNARSLMGELASYNLIVSIMGNWAAESYLNDMQQRANGFPPVLYSWVEPHAAAHALLISRNAACLRCGTDDKGRPHLKVTNWPNGGDSLQEPACGEQFTPYGPAELCWAHALLSEAAIDALTGQASAGCHRIWIGAYSRTKAAGGIWAADWIAEMGDPGDGSMKVERRWSISESCPACVRRDGVLH